MDLGVGKRQRKKPKYLRDEEEDDNESVNSVNTTASSKLKKELHPTADEENPPEIRPSKHKPPKKKKSKKKNKESKPPKQPERKPTIKVKLKLGGKPINSEPPLTAIPPKRSKKEKIVPIQQTFEESDEEINIEESSVDEEPFDMDVSNDNASTMPMLGKQPKTAALEDAETSDEEREWLEAIEAGEIDDYEQKKAKKNPAILTARQRRLVTGNEDDSLLELPSQYKTKALTEEQLAKRQQRAVKRRQVAQEKNEKAKKLTVDRLLKKQDPAVKGKAKAAAGKKVIPHMRYTLSRDSLTISLPHNSPFPLSTQAAKPAPVPLYCSVKGCKNLKRYSCSKTHKPLCSLQCYKVNLTNCKVA